MKRRIIVITITIVILCLGIYLFFHKTYPPFELVCEIDTSEKFYPDAYTFFHTEADFNRYAGINESTRLEGDKCRPSLKFSNYSHVIVYGRKIKSMYHSNKSTFFEDESAHYIRRLGRKVIFVEYEDAQEGTGTYIYRLKKDKAYRGFFGI